MKHLPLLPWLLLVAACAPNDAKDLKDFKDPKDLKDLKDPKDPTVTAPPALVLTGSVVADPGRTLRIVAPIGGRVEGLAVEVGDAVRAGQPVARLVGSEAAELGIQRHQAEAECRLARRELDLRQSLFADGLASEQELDAARERHGVAEAALAQLASVPSGDIVATRSGTVLQRPVVNGQYVQAGDLLMEVADLGVVWVMADVYEGDIGRVHRGDSVRVHTLAYPDESLGGVIDKVYSALDPDSKTMKVRIVLASTHLLPGMFATVDLK